MPAVATLSLQGAVGQSANLVEVKNSTGTVLAIVDLAGNLNAPSLIPTGSTVPTNGVYLPAANTLGLATASTSRVQIGSTGKIGIGITPPSATSVNLASNMTGSTATTGFRSAGIVQSDSTATASYFATAASTQAAAFTTTNLFHYQASQGTFGASSVVTNQYGFYVDSTLIGAATNNFAFYANTPSGAGRWNLYMNGTAANYFTGQTTVGSTSLTLGGGSVAQQFGVVSGATTTVGAVIRGAASQSANLTEWQNSTPTTLTAITSAGTINFASGNTSSTATIGAITAPVMVAGYITMQVAGTTVKVPYFNN